MASPAGRGAQVRLDGNDQAAARGALAPTLDGNVEAKRVLEFTGAVADGSTPDGSTRTGQAADDELLAPLGTDLAGAAAAVIAASTAAAASQAAAEAAAAPLAASVAVVTGYDTRMVSVEGKTREVRSTDAVTLGSLTFSFLHTIGGYSIYDYGPMHLRGGGLTALRASDKSWTLSAPGGTFVTQSTAGKFSYKDLPIGTIDVPGAHVVQKFSDGRFVAARWDPVDGALRKLGSNVSTGAVTAFTTAQLTVYAAEARDYTSKVRRKTVTLHKPTERRVLWIGYGQSLAVGWEGWPPLSRTAPLNCTMPGQSVHGIGTTSFAAVGGSMAPTPLASTVIISNAVASDATIAALTPGDTAYGETYLESFAAQFRPAWLRYTGYPAGNAANEWHFAECGAGNMPIASLSPGASPDRFNKLKDLIAKFIVQCTADGISNYSVGGIIFDQGQNDYGLNTSQATYDAALEALFTAIRAEVATQIPSQTGTLPIYMFQTGGQYTNDAGTLAVGRAQIAVASRMPGVFIVGPNQHVTDKGGHLSSNGTRWLGCAAGKVAIRTLIDDQGWEPTRIIRWAVRGRTLVGLLHVPTGDAQVSVPYVGFTPSPASTATDLGVYVEDGSGAVAVSEARIDQGRLLIVTLGRDTSGTVRPWLGRLSTVNGAVCISDGDRTTSVYPYVYTAGSGQTTAENVAALVGYTYPTENFCLADAPAATAE